VCSGLKKSLRKYVIPAGAVAREKAEYEAYLKSKKRDPKKHFSLEAEASASTRTSKTPTAEENYYSPVIEDDDG
jgi:hypothetical protein